MRVLGWVLFVVVAVVVITFAVQNRGSVMISLEPVFAPMSMPLFAALSITFGFGFILGALVDWLLGLGSRWRARSRRHEAERLRREVDRLSAELAAAQRQALAAETAPPGTTAGGPVAVAHTRR